MTRYFLGIDVGGSKSHALIADETGTALGFGVDGAGNYEVVGYKGFQDVLHSIIHQAVEYAGIKKDEIAGAGFGLAGYDWPCDREPVLQVLDTLELNAPFEFVNDAVIGLLAGASAGWGVSVVAGTSCNCRGRDQNGREGRVVGGGSNYSEYGGAWELVMMARQAISRAWSLRGPQTILTQRFIEKFGAADAGDLMEGMYRGRYQINARFAPLVFEAAAEGDTIANELILRVSQELGNLAIGVIRQLGFEAEEFEVVLAGSFYRGSPTISDTVAETVREVAPYARFVHLTVPPVVGAVVLGMEQARVPYSSVREKLIETTAHLLKMTE
jgi:N-acetylglucosamine kinase-like BadF-type ATPase